MPLQRSPAWSCHPPPVDINCSMINTILCKSCSVGFISINSKTPLAKAAANIDDVPNPDPLGTFLTLELMLKPDPNLVNISFKFPPF